MTKKSLISSEPPIWTAGRVERLIARGNLTWLVNYLNVMDAKIKQQPGYSDSTLGPPTE